ncbi:MAG TPA: hypothetical protein VIL86_17180 [Tepidisphaeraceae bacterium]|jgi:hypothetical protein
MKSWCAVAAVASLLLVVFPARALAHRDDYIDETLVFLTLERHETEAEYWLDFGRNSEKGRDFLRHNVAAEFGITDHWMVDGRATAIHELGDGFDFDSGRFESRYRFFDEGTLPIDIAISGEANMEREEDGSYLCGLEPRLILSRDFGEAVNLTLNLQEEFPLNGKRRSRDLSSDFTSLAVPLRSDQPAFVVSGGFRVTVSELIRIGSEARYNFETQEGAVIPQVWLTFPHDVTVKIGISLPFDQSKETFFRIALEVGF